MGLESARALWYWTWAPEDAPNEWTHQVTGSGGDNGMMFRYFWLPQTEWGKLFGDFKLAYPTLERWLTREISMGTK